LRSLRLCAFARKKDETITFASLRLCEKKNEGTRFASLRLCENNETITFESLREHKMKQ